MRTHRARMTRSAAGDYGILKRGGARVLGARGQRYFWRPALLKAAGAWGSA